MSRTKAPPRRTIILRLDEILFAELMLLKPGMQNASGYTKYGALNSYFTNLMRRDLEQVKDKLRNSGATP